MERVEDTMMSEDDKELPLALPPLGSMGLFSVSFLYRMMSSPQATREQYLSQETT